VSILKRSLCDSFVPKQHGHRITPPFCEETCTGAPQALLDPVRGSDHGAVGKQHQRGDPATHASPEPNGDPAAGHSSPNATRNATTSQNGHRKTIIPSSVMLLRGNRSGGIRTPGASRHARFQVAGEPCAGVCPRLPSCGFSRDSSGSAWGRQQSVATRLLHADAQSISIAASSRTCRHGGRSRGRWRTS
jgi:hypothetical protein